MAKRSSNPKPKTAARGKPDVLKVESTPDKSDARVYAEICLDPNATTTAAATPFTKMALSCDNLDLTELHLVLREQTEASTAGDLSIQRRMLAGQAATLNAIFASCARRAANIFDYPDAAERYMRLALKAQAQCRTTIEALDKMLNGREQTVRHVHVYPGGQAVVAETINAGGRTSGFDPIKPYGAEAAGGGPALLGEDTQRNGVPVPGDAKRKVSTARRGDGEGGGTEGE